METERKKETINTEVSFLQRAHDYKSHDKSGKRTYELTKSVGRGPGRARPGSELLSGHRCPSTIASNDSGITYHPVHQLLRAHTLLTTPHRFMQAAGGCGICLA